MTQTEKAKQALAKVKVRPMSPDVIDIRRNINMIQEAMQATFKKEVHYGVIPGCGKPSLYKAGAETLIALFKLTFQPTPLPVEQKEGEVRYLIRMDLSTRDGVLIGSGLGECSSCEEKYMWRKAVSDKEFENTAEHLKRIKYKPTYEINQVRVSPADMANTILKMAKKRALIDAVLTATAASDIFTQDIQDLPEGYMPPAEVVDTEPPAEDPGAVQKAKEQEELRNGQGQPVDPVDHTERSGPVISEPQRKRLYAIAMQAGMKKEEFKEWLMFTFNYESSKDILKSDYESVCSEAEAYGGAA